MSDIEITAVVSEEVISAKYVAEQVISAQITLGAQGIQGEKGDDATPTLGVNVQSGTSYTLQASDVGKVIRFTNAGAIAFSLNTPEATAGMNFIVEQAVGAGQVTFGGTATLQNYDNHTKTAGQKASVSFFCSVAGTFNFSGRTA